MVDNPNKYFTTIRGRTQNGDADPRRGLHTLFPRARQRRGFALRPRPTLFMVPIPHETRPTPDKNMTQPRDTPAEPKAPELFRSALEALGQGAAILNQNRTVLYCNGFLAGLLALPPEEISGRDFASLVHSPASSPPSGLSAPGVFEAELLAGNGRRVRARLELLPIKPEDDPSFQGFLCLASKIKSEKTPGETNFCLALEENSPPGNNRNKEEEDQLLYQACHDTLTGLNNRPVFLDHLDKALARSSRSPTQPFAVIFIDLDRFKVVNDTMGHLAGDHLLVSLAKRFSTCLRSEDTFARLGGDEFAVLLHNVKDTADILRVVKRLTASLKNPFRIQGRDIQAGASLGIVMADARYESPEQVLRDADIAMYRAKADPSRVYALFDETMHADAAERLRVETDMASALDRGEFLLHYQPVISLETGRVAAFEALLRWQRPGYGLVPPGIFLPALEDTRLILPLGEWILREACEQIKAWRTGFDRTDLLLGVNLSSRQFTPELVSVLKKVLSRTGIDPACLKLEVTEQTLTERTAPTTENMAGLAAMGVRLCIDDFGAESASLSCLRRFPVDMIKIDRSVIATLKDDPEPRVVKAVLAMARELDIHPVAEGVESKRQVDRLLRLGCDHAQGYYFSKPLSVAEAETFLSEN